MPQLHHDDDLNYEDYVDGLRRSNTALLAAVTDLLGDRPSVQGGICRQCGRDFIGDILEGDCPADDCPSYKARSLIAAIHESSILSSQNITIHLEGGFVQDVTGIPAGYEVRVEDYGFPETDDDSWDADKKCVVTVYEGANHG